MSCSSVTGDIGSKSFLPGLPRLRRLQLAFTRVKGDIGQLHLPATLQELWLTRSSSVHGDIGDLHLPEGVTALGLDGTDVTGRVNDVKLPSAIQQCFLGGEGLGGELHSLRLGDLSSLTIFQAANTQVSGPIPSLPPSLRRLNLANSGISGDLSGVRLGPNVEHVVLAGCKKLSGDAGGWRP